VRAGCHLTPVTSQEVKSRGISLGRAFLFEVLTCGDSYMAVLRDLAPYSFFREVQAFGRGLLCSVCYLMTLPVAQIMQHR
jgi:hypothetical protein